MASKIQMLTTALGVLLLAPQTVGPGMATGGQTVGPGMTRGGQTVGPGMASRGVTVGPGMTTGSFGFSYRTVDSGTHSAETRQTLVLLQTANDFESWWTKRLGRDLRMCRADQFNWMKDRLVAVHLGTRPTGGYGLMVKSLKRKDAATLTLAVEERCPQPGWMTTQALTSPWVLVRIDRNAANIELRVERPQAVPRQ